MKQELVFISICLFVAAGRLQWQQNMQKTIQSKVIKYIHIIIVPICGIIVSVVGIIIAYSQFVIAEKEAIMSAFVQPVIYKIYYQDANTEYQIIDNGEVYTIKAMEPVITIESGAIKELTVFGFDGEELYLNQNETPGRNAKSITVKAQVSTNPLIIGQNFYDYLFIYIEPVEGEPMLDLVCAEIDLTNSTIIRTHRYRKHRLLSLELDAPLDPAEKHMLETYRKLYLMISDLEEWSSL